MLKNALIILSAFVLFALFLLWMYRPGEVVAPYLFLSWGILPFWKKQNIAPKYPLDIKSLGSGQGRARKLPVNQNLSEFVAQQRAVLAQSTPTPSPIYEETDMNAQDTQPAQTVSETPIIYAEERYEMQIEYENKYNVEQARIMDTLKERFVFEPNKLALRSLPNEQVYGASAYNYRTFGRALRRAEQMELLGVENQDGREIYRLRDLVTGEFYITFMAPREYGKPDSHGKRRPVMCWHVLKWDAKNQRWYRHASHASAINAAFKEKSPGNNSGPWNPHRYAVQMGVVTALLMGWNIHIQGGNSDKAYRYMADKYQHECEVRA